MKVVAITEPTGLMQLREQWAALWRCSVAQRVHLSYEWFLAGWESFHPHDQLHILTVLDDGQCVGIAPLVITSGVYRGFKVKKICFPLNSQSPSCDFILTRGMEAACLARIIDYLNGFYHWDLVELQKLEIDGSTGSFLKNSLADRGAFFGIRPTIESPYIPIEGDWLTFWQGKSIRFRKSMRNKLNRAEKSGDLTYEKVQIVNDEAPELDEMLRISSKSWKQDIGKDLLTKKNSWTFYKKICALLGSSGYINLWILRKSNKGIAFEFHLNCHGVVCPIRADYDESFKEISPGSILEHEIIKSLFFPENKTLEYNSCGHTYNYLMNWTSRTRKYGNFEAFNKSPKMAGLYFFEYKALPWLRRMKVNTAFHCIKRTVREMNVNRALNGLRVVSKDLLALGKRELNFYRARPVASILFLTYRCDSKCKTCTMWKHSQVEEQKKEIGIEGWKAIIDKLAAAGIQSVEIFGGNVLLRKELLVAILAYLHDKGIVIHLPTNQIGLDDEVAEAIVNYVDAVYISADGLGGQQDDIRGVKDACQNVGQAITGLRRLKDGLGHAGKKTRLVCNVTVSKYNVNLIEKMVDYAVTMKFDEVHFEYVGEFNREDVDRSVINGLKPNPYFIKQGETILVDKVGAKKVKENIEKVKNKYADSDIVVSTINIDSLSEENLFLGTIPHNKCYLERREITVDPSGDLVICPFINNYKLGSLLSEPLDRLWNNEKHQIFRAIQNRGDLPMCAHCILGVQRNPGMLNSLKRIYLSRIKPVLESR